MLKSWKEIQATSTKRDSYNNWHIPWLGLNNIDATTHATGQTTIYPSTPKGFVQIDVTSAAEAWKSGSSNYGVVIRATNENIVGRDTRFASNADSDSSRHAFVLLICDSGIGNSGGPSPTPYYYHYG